MDTDYIYRQGIGQKEQEEKNIQITRLSVSTYSLALPQEVAQWTNQITTLNLPIMKKLFCIIALLFTLTAAAQSTSQEELITSSIDSVEYSKALVFADEIFKADNDCETITFFQLYTDIWYERTQYKTTGQVVYVKQIREESYGY